MIALALVLSTAAAQAQPFDFAHATTEAIMARGREALATMGAYKVRLTKEERIGDKLQKPQTIQLWVREAPLAIRAEYVGGDPAGRKAIYDAELRPKDVRVREHGVLGAFGGLWIDIHGSLALGDTNHDMTEVGFGAILRLQQLNADRLKPFGGYLRTDVGLNERGRYCVQFDAPPAASSVYATRSVICHDPLSGIPMEMTNWDKKGLLERFVFQDLEPHAAEGSQVFVIASVGL